MFILLIMAVGIVIGFLFFPGKNLKWAYYIQFITTCLLIFSMGVVLGAKENFINELFSLGIKSFLFALIPIIFSVIAVYFVTKKIFGSGEK